MKTFELDEIALELQAIFLKSKENILIVKKGKPLASIVPLNKENLESVKLSLDEKFNSMIEASRKSIKEGRKKSLNEIEQKYLY